MGTKLTAIAAASAALAVSMPAEAGMMEFDNGWNIDYGLTTTYTLGMRVKSPDPVLAGPGNSGGNDGDASFKAGSLTADRLALLLETKIHKDNYGFVVSASTFYDTVYHTPNDNPGPVNFPGPVNHFNSSTEYYHGGYSRLLDAYGYTTFDIGSARATVRLGQQVVSWGEALFFPGISLAQGPADGTLQGIPGTETKDILLPEPQLSTSIDLSPRWSLLGQLQFDWHPNIAPGVGSFLSTSDSVGPGATCLQPVIKGKCSFGARQADQVPDNFGQFGLGTRFRATDETELGLYYLYYKDRNPLPVINAFAPGGTYSLRYFDNINLIGATFSTMLGSKVTVAGEVSQKFGAPVLVNTVVNPRTRSTIPTPTRANITQVNLNAFANLGRTFIAPQTVLIGEVSWVGISGVTATRAAGVDALGPAAAYFPSSDKLSFTHTALAISGTVSLTWPGIFTDWDLAVPISYSQQIMGRTITGGVGGQGDKRYSISANFKFRSNFQIGLNYLGYLGSANTTLADARLLTDRDQISLVMKYKF
ncbi:DUF1302 domain-containing protein [Paraburkholderia sacchari]|uniref:DUF1302 domain-containing protein n=1 Tax=Paraburkholderia sacchari TaxID=159450 RepID=UPI001FD32D20|nr:DUF1302 family protein [Paraburkholderia sacchari]